ncbi:hypothetical protein [Streptomyces osmaniensis]|uniref:hypothetical protein n=1 Tax=Streptomyces osmaniensis TaxID=593134 RepID=UPI001C32CC6C|nr:hypothetical protein KJK32_15155 [Streptomyces sp. JCM17656]
MAGVAAASAALVMAVANSAAAADHTMHTGDAWGNVPGVDWSGTGFFNEYGDVVTIKDNDADGSGVIMYVYIGSPASGTKIYSFHVGGEGNTATRKASMGGVYNLPENKNIGFKFCRYSDTQPGGECKDYTFLNDN